MSEKQREKLFTQIKRNTKNVRFEDLIKLYEMFGFEVRKPRRGAHHICELDNYTISSPNTPLSLIHI